MRARLSVALSLGITVTVSATGCGPSATDTALAQARQTLDASERALAEADEETRGGEFLHASPEAQRQIRSAMHVAENRLETSTQAVETFSNDGLGAGWAAIAPCLASALDAVEEAFVHAHLVAPSGIDEASTMAAGVSEQHCGR